MGGSGGGGGGGYRLNPSDLSRLREEAQARIDRGRIDAEVNSLLQHELLELNDRDNESVNSRLEGVEKSLKDTIQEFDRVLFGGSVAKHTYVDGLSDIDALVVLDPTVVGDKTPEQVRQELREILRRKLDMSAVEEIRVGRMAVTIVYRDRMEIQLLPAAKRGESLAISSPTGKDWAEINPKEFANRLSRLNEHQGRNVIPAIKLAKAIIAEQIPEHLRPTGYHVEALAIAAFQDYDGPRTPKAMAQRFFEGASGAVMRPIGDVTGQSRYVDDALGEAGSTDRRNLARHFGLIAKRMQQADSVAVWRSLLGS